MVTSYQHYEIISCSFQEEKNMWLGFQPIGCYVGPSLYRCQEQLSSVVARLDELAKTLAASKTLGQRLMMTCRRNATAISVNSTRNYSHLSVGHISTGKRIFLGHCLYATGCWN